MLNALRDVLGRLREGPDIGPKVAAKIADIVEREVAALTTQLDAAKESEQNYKNLWHVTTRDLVIDTAKLEAELNAAKRALVEMQEEKPFIWHCEDNYGRTLLTFSEESTHRWFNVTPLYRRAALAAKSTEQEIK